jgi:hypothetical protein
MLLGRLTSELICLFAKTTKAAITAWMKMGRAMAGGGGQHMVYVLYLHALVQSNPYLIAISPRYIFKDKTYSHESSPSRSVTRGAT